MQRNKSGHVGTISKAKEYIVDNHERPLGDRYVTMSNALVRAGQGLELAEKRIVALGIAKLDSFRAISPLEPDPVTRITAAEYSETFDVDISLAYRALAAASKQLFMRYITFYTPAYRRNGQPLPPTRVQIHWVTEVHYQEGEGWVDLHWVPKLLPQLTGLKKQFTTYQLHQVSGLRSVYAWRLLELLKRFESTGWFDIAIEDFGASMEATEKQMANFANLRRKMIEPAIRELTEKDYWVIVWDTVKAGRKVKSLKFRFARSGQQHLPL